MKRREFKLNYKNRIMDFIDTYELDQAKMKSDDSIYHCDDKEWGYYPNCSPKRILYMFHNDCDRITVEVSFDKDTYFD